MEHRVCKIIENLCVGTNCFLPRMAQSYREVAKTRIVAFAVFFSICVFGIPGLSHATGFHFGGSGLGGMSVQDYIKNRELSKQSGTIRKILDIYLSGVRNSMLTANAELRRNKKELLFCEKQGERSIYRIPVSDLTENMDDHLRNNPAPPIEVGGEKSEYPFEMVFLEMLRERFSCVN